jgi:hypothetical protein
MTSSRRENQLGNEKIQAALEALDEACTVNFKLIIGGGGALVSAYKFPLMTEDLDAVPVGIEILDLDPLIKAVARKLDLPLDWMNPYFSSFMHVLPKDYSLRLRSIFKGTRIEALALGPEDLLIMKCFAGRDKDIPHARALLKQPRIDLKIVEDRIFELKNKNIPGASKALDFFEEQTE